MGYIKTQLTLLGMTLLASGLTASAMPVDLSVGKLPKVSLPVTPIAEGLYENGVPATLSSVWDNTFLIYGATKTGNMIHEFIGTGYPIAKRKVGNVNYVMMLTAGHVGTLVEKLRADQGDVLQIAQNGQVHFADNAEPNFTGTLKAQMKKMVTSVDLDASAILMTVPSAQFASLMPLHFPAAGCKIPAGTKNYIVGFPSVSDRPVANQNVKIVDPLIILKRWSEGFITDQFGFDDFQTNESTRVDFIGSTADGLEGSSGSPALDASGNLIGMLNAGEDDAHYSGDEKPGAMKPYSYLAPCDQLLKFTTDSWKALLP